MTTTSIPDHVSVVWGKDDRTARPIASSPSVKALRAESHTALTHLVAALGYPPHWVDELERRAFAAGRVWSGTPCSEKGGHADGSRRERGADQAPSS